MAPAPIYLPYVDTIRQLCEQGLTDAQIAEKLPIEANRNGIYGFRRVHGIKGTVGVGAPKYPWKDWLNGEEVTITRGVDFHISLVYMRRHVKTTARMHGGTVTIRTEGRSLILKFEKGDDHGKHDRGSHAE